MIGLLGCAGGGRDVARRPLIGALAAGILVRQTIFGTEIPRWEEHDVARSIHIMSFGFLIPLFFVWIGVRTDIFAVAQSLPLILTLVVITTVGTVLGSALAIRITHGSWKEAWAVGWGLNPKGDVDLVIAVLALSAGVITDALFSAVVIMSLIVTIISPIIFKRLALKYRRA